MVQEEIIIRCLSCGTKNRILKDRLGKRPMCGRCHAPLDEMIIRCLACGKKNLMPENRLNERPLCGSCGAPLVIGTTRYSPQEVSDRTFKSEVLAYPGSVVVDCWAPWCGPCRQLAPILDDLASKYAGAVKIAKLNIDENPSTASQYQVRSIPTLLFFKSGVLAGTLVGLQAKADIENRILDVMKRD